MICFQNVSLIYCYPTISFRRGEPYRVVICFQNVSLIYCYPTKLFLEKTLDGLWFAFRMYLWFIAIQHHGLSRKAGTCCDLLSECIFDLLLSNLLHWKWFSFFVVICFQNVSLIYCYPTSSIKWLSLNVLWFAFRMYLWFIAIQLCASNPLRTKCCDLLSECIFDLLLSNFHQLVKHHVNVVICFQNVSLIYCYPTDLAER